MDENNEVQNTDTEKKEADQSDNESTSQKTAAEAEVTESEKDDAPHFCTHCGKPLPPHAAFCPNCGTPVHGNAETSKKEHPHKHIHLDFSSFAVYPLIFKDPFQLHGMSLLPACCGAIALLVFNWLGYSLLGFGTAFFMTLFQIGGMLVMRTLETKDHFDFKNAFCQSIEILTLPTALTIISSIIMHLSVSTLSDSYSSATSGIAAALFISISAAFLKAVIAMKVNDHLSGWTIWGIFVGETLLIVIICLAGSGSAAMHLLEQFSEILTGF